MQEQRIDFYRGATAFRRRRRRTISIYSPGERSSGLDQNRIQIDNTVSYEEYYKQYNNIQTLDSTEVNLPKSTKFLGENIFRSEHFTKQAQQKSRKRRTTKNKPIISEQGQENSTRMVQYKDKKGDIYYKSGGTPAWRHNNPGNLSFSSLEIAKKHGAIDVVLDRDKSGKIIHRWGVFENEQAGEKAMRNLLRERRSSYYPNGEKKSIAGMISSIYAPASDNNNVSAYANFVKKHSGIDVYNRSVADLSNEEFDRLIEAIKAREMSVKGKILYPEQNEQ